MKYLIIFMCIFSSCKRRAEVTKINQVVCSAKQKERLAQFIIDCSRAANPMSDEKGEDLVEQCERSGRITICEEVTRCQTNYYDWSGWDGQDPAEECKQ